VRLESSSCSLMRLTTWLVSTFRREICRAQPTCWQRPRVSISAPELRRCLTYRSGSQHGGATNADDVVTASWALPELVEAASRCGRTQVATDAVDRLSERALASGTNWAKGTLARARALIEDSEDAEKYHRQAIELLGHTRMRAQLARARLCYGEWLRRQNRRVDARDQLRQAHDTLAKMGADGFAQRAGRELLATGEKVRKRRDDARNALTPQEEHIARLARDGKTNPEIGAELFISSRTVEWHLRKVFTKLGISSRKGLRAALQGRD
jgi:DNA-binding CsgD family transcriptional regulator